MSRKRRKKSKATENSPSLSHGSYVELNENAVVASRQEDVDTEYDTTTTTRSNPIVSCVEDDYSRLRISNVPFADSAYSHVKKNQQNACAASRVDDDYGRLELSQVRFEDPTYSHVRNNQQGACALLEVDYSYLGRNDTKAKCTDNEQYNEVVHDYDNVRFNQSCNVRPVKTGLNFGTCNDDVYDNLQNKL